MFRVARVLALCAAVGLAACGDDDMTGLGAETLVGAWTVVSVNGQNLPWTETFSDPAVGTCTFTLTSMGVTFRENGTYSGTLVSTSGCNDELETLDDPTEGTYRTSGSRLYLTLATDDEPEEAELQYFFNGPNRLTLRETFEGQTSVMVLRRE